MQQRHLKIGLIKAMPIKKANNEMQTFIISRLLMQTEPVKERVP